MKTVNVSKMKFVKSLLVAALLWPFLAIGQGTNIWVTFQSTYFTGTPQAYGFTISLARNSLVQPWNGGAVTGIPLYLPGQTNAWTTNLYTGQYKVLIDNIGYTLNMNVTTNFGPGPVPFMSFVTNAPGYLPTNLPAGVLAVTAGTNITITGTAQNPVINAGSGFPSNGITNGQSGVEFLNQTNNAITITNTGIAMVLGADGLRLNGSPVVESSSGATLLYDSSGLLIGTDRVAIDIGDNPARAVTITGPVTANLAGGYGLPWSGLPSTVLTNAAAFTPAGAFTNYGAPVYAMPVSVSNALVGQYWGPATMWVDPTNGNDGASVLGDSTHPALHVGYALSALPSGTGAVWMLPGNHFYGAPMFPTNTVALVGPGAILSLTNASGAGFNAPRIWLTNSASVNVWGLTIDEQTLASLAFGGTFQMNKATNGSLGLHYCYLIGPGDNIYFANTANFTNLVEHTKITSAYDNWHPNGASGIVGCLTVVSDSEIIADGSLPPQYSGDPARAIECNGASYWYLRNCTFTAQNGTGAGNQGFQYSVSAGSGATVSMQNCRLIGGTGGTNFTAIKASGAGTLVTLRDMVVPSSLISTDGLAVVTYGIADAFYGAVIGTGAGLTNIPSATNAINATNFWGLLSATNLPAGISSSNYVGSHIGTGAGLTNLNATNLVGSISTPQFTSGSGTNTNNFGIGGNLLVSGTATAAQVTLSGTANDAIIRQYGTNEIDIGFTNGGGGFVQVLRGQTNANSSNQQWVNVAVAGSVSASGFAGSAAGLTNTTFCAPIIYASSGATWGTTTYYTYPLGGPASVCTSYEPNTKAMLDNLSLVGVTMTLQTACGAGTNISVLLRTNGLNAYAFSILPGQTSTNITLATPIFIPFGVTANWMLSNNVSGAFAAPSAIMSATWRR